MSKPIVNGPPDDNYRPNLLFRDSDCPGIIDFLRRLPARSQAAFFRGVIYPWFLRHQASGSLDSAMKEAVRLGMSAHLGLEVDSRLLSTSQDRGATTGQSPEQLATHKETLAGVVKSERIPLPSPTGQEMAREIDALRDDAGFDFDAEARALGIL